MCLSHPSYRVTCYFRFWKHECSSRPDKTLIYFCLNTNRLNAITVIESCKLSFATFVMSFSDNRRFSKIKSFCCTRRTSSDPIQNLKDSRRSTKISRLLEKRKKKKKEKEKKEIIRREESAHVRRGSEKAGGRKEGWFLNQTNRSKSSSCLSLNPAVSP